MSTILTVHGENQRPSECLIKSRELSLKRSHKKSLIDLKNNTKQKGNQIPEGIAWQELTLG